jgi:hypothetical protein
MKKFLLFKLPVVIIAFLLKASMLNAQDDIAYGFEADKEGWSGAGAVTTASGGDLILTSKDNAFPVARIGYSPAVTTEFTEMRIRLKNATTQQALQLMVFTSQWADKVLYDFNSVGTNETDYNDYVIDLTGQTISPSIAGFGIKVKDKTLGAGQQLFVDTITFVAAEVVGTSYNLSSSVTGAGVISPESGTYAENSVLSIDAIPFLGYSFNSWGGDASGTDNPLSLTMDADKNITATFDKIADFDFVWNFNTDGDSEGWSNTNSNAVVAGGNNTMEITGNNPKMNITQLGISAEDYGVIEIRLKNNTDVLGINTDSCMRFIYVPTGGGNNFFNIDTSLGSTANDPDFKVYQLRVGDKASWSGNIEELTFVGPRNVEVQDGSETVDIDYIKLLKKQAQTITFDALSDVADNVPYFILSATASSGLDLSYSSSDEAVVRVSNDTAYVVAPGSAIITASQNGDAFFYAAADVDQSITVKQSQAITFGALDAKTIVDPAFDLTATASSGLTVTYTSSDEGVATISGSTVTIVGVGATTITASQAGDATYYPANDVLQELVVTKVEQTITFGALDPKTTNDPDFALTATASSGLTVTYTSSDEGVATVSGSTVTIVGVGTTTITASQAGDATYAPADDVLQSLTVTDPALLDQTITFDALSDKVYGDAAFELTATASSGLAVTYTSSDETVATVSGTTVTIVGAGSTTITASQAGDETYNAAADVQQVLTVNKADQTITFDALSDKVYGDAAFELTATASSGLAVTYSSSDETVATVSGTTVTIVGAGSTTITASQAGDADYNAATDVQQVLTVNKADQTITFDALSEKTVGDAAFELTATASSGFAVSYSSSDETVATVSGTTVTIVGAGTTTITASQAGDETYNAAADVQQVFTVNKADQTITFDALSEKTVGDAAFELTATASSGLAVSYTSSDETVATVSGTTVTIVGAGTTTITASQAGDATYNAAVDVTQSLTVNAATNIANVITENLYDVYPNPANDFIKIKGLEGTGSIKIYNINGALISEQLIHEDMVIDMSGFSAGIYYFTIQNQGEVSITKVIKR